MSIDLVTGYAGSSHITAEKVRLGNCGIVGNADYVLNTGNKFAATIVTNNKVSIASGDAMMQGAHISIAPGSTEDAVIANCTAGMYRNDIICLQYSKNTSTGVETASVVVVKGEAGVTAVDPVVTTGDLSAGDALHQMPLYRVKINGLSITSVDALYLLCNQLSDIKNSIKNNLQFASGWSNQWATSYYTKDKFGRVVLSISAVANATITTSAYVTIATLPEGFRPSNPHNYGLAFDANNSGIVSVDVLPDGSVKAIPIGGNTDIRTVKGTFIFDI